MSQRWFSKASLGVTAGASVTGVQDGATRKQKVNIHILYSFAEMFRLFNQTCLQTSTCSQGRQSLGSRLLHLADRTVMIITGMSTNLTLPLHLFLLCQLFTSGSPVRLVWRAGVHDGTETSVFDVSSFIVNNGVRSRIFLPSLFGQNDRISCARQLRINYWPFLAKAVTYKLEAIFVRGYRSIIRDDSDWRAGTDMFQSWLEMWRYSGTMCRGLRLIWIHYHLRYNRRRTTCIGMSGWISLTILLESVACCKSIRWHSWNIIRTRQRLRASPFAVLHVDFLRT
jgi:hypothetical protein